jgi:hypothetical protein
MTSLSEKHLHTVRIRLCHPWRQMIHGMRFHVSLSIFCMKNCNLASQFQFLASKPHTHSYRSQEASKYGGASTVRVTSTAPVPAATFGGGVLPVYGQQRYSPVLPTEVVKVGEAMKHRQKSEWGGLADLDELSQNPTPFTDAQFNDGVIEAAAKEEGEEEGEEEEEFSDGGDGEEDDLMWFDGHDGVSGDFTKTFKAEVAGNRPNSAATQANVLLARARRAQGEQRGGAGGKQASEEILRRFQPTTVRNAKAERRICTQSLNEKRLQQLSETMHKSVFGGGGDKAERARGTKDKADRATTEQVN